MLGYAILIALLGSTTARPNVPLGSVSVSPAGFSCPPIGHYLLPHEWDCTKFYECEYGEKRPVPRDCAPGTEFAFEIQVCIHPALANCELPGSPPEEEESSEEVTTTEAVQTTEEDVTTTSAPQTTEKEKPTTTAPTTTEKERPTTLAPTTTEKEKPTTSAPQSTEASVISTTTTAAPTTTEKDKPTTSAPQSTEASVISTTTTSAPTTTEKEKPTTSAPQSTEASVISTTTTAAPTTTEKEKPTTSAPQSTEASVISTTTTAAPTTTEKEKPTTSAPQSTEASVISTTTTSAPTTTEKEKPTTSAPQSTEASVISTTTTAAPTTTEKEKPTTSAPQSTEASIISTTTSVPVIDSDESEDLELLPNGCPADLQIHHLLPHEKNCDQFYYCDHGEKVLRQCAPGTHFNAVLQVCDWPENAGCAISESSEKEDSIEENEGSLENKEGSGEENEDSLESSEGSGQPDIDSEDDILSNGCPSDWDIHQLLPHEKDCSKFYQCVFGNTVERECPDGTLFNAEIQVCDWPQNVNCKNSGSSEDNSGNNGNSDENNGNSEENNGSEDNENESGKGSAEVEDNGCPSDWDIHQLLPHESDCGKFYQCDHGNTVERECAPGTHFNAVIQVCDWPENAGCANSGSSTEESSEEILTTAAPQSTEASIISTTLAPETELLPNGCPADFNIHQLLAHESECGKFYQCANGEKVERECAPGTYFNPAIQVCDWPENVDCTNSGSSNEDDKNSDEKNGSEENESGNGNGSSEVEDNGCPSDWDIHQLLPHESECGKFYQCANGEKVERECAPGTYFNPAIQVCDWPENVNCANSGSSNEDDKNSEEKNRSEENENGNGNGCPSDWDIHQLLPHESECGKFYQCANGEKVERECAPGTHFNAAIQVCDWPENAGCANSESSTEESSEETTTTAAPQSTEASVISTTTTSAPTTTEEEKPTTSAPQSTEASVISTTTTSAPPTTEKEKPTTSAPLSTEASIISTTTSAPTTEASEENGSEEKENESGNGSEENENESGNGSEENVNKCADSCNAGPWAHETDCDKFWRCDGDKEVEGVCSEGLHFNDKTKTCDFICNAGCVRENAEATAQNDGVRIFLPWDKIDSKMIKYVEKYKHSHGA